MKKRGSFLAMTFVFLMGSLLAAAPLRAESTEYTDSERQTRWEGAQQKRAEKAERRRAFLSRWIDGSFGKLRPHRQPHLDDQAAGTVSSIDTGGELK